MLEKKLGGKVQFKKLDVRGGGYQTPIYNKMLLQK